MAAIVEGPGIAALSCGKPVYLVVLLSGSGCDSQALVSHALNWAPTMPKAEFLAAEMASPGSWFDLSGNSPAKTNEGLLAFGPELDHFLDEMLAKRRLPDSHLALVGFSQGAMLALHVGLRRPKPMAAIVAFSGALFDLASLESEIHSKPPVLFIHGEEDPVVPFAAMTDTKNQLKALGVPAKSLKRPGLAHAIDDDGIIVAGDFLTGLVVHKPAAKPDADNHEHDHDHDHEHDDHEHEHH
ncbi:MAG TPA: dienelactone hydrolase family protein [Methylocella sp.]|nr:dienelactone hydrolase family protein [Methylocella sp.]